MTAGQGHQQVSYCELLQVASREELLMERILLMRRLTHKSNRIASLTEVRITPCPVEVRRDIPVRPLSKVQAGVPFALQPPGLM